MPDYIIVSDNVMYGKRVVKAYFEVGKYLCVLDNVPQEWLPDQVDNLIRADYEYAKQFFINGLFVAGAM